MVSTYKNIVVANLVFAKYLFVKSLILYYYIDEFCFYIFVIIMKKKIVILGTIMIFGLFLGACSLPWSKDKQIEATNSADLELTEDSQGLETPVLASASLKKFSDYQEFRNFLTINQPESVNSYQIGLEALGMVAREGLIMNKASLSSDSLDSVNTDDYSRTNVQVAGVDEADIIKTDGQYIYALVYQDLYIIKAVPAEQARAITKLSFPDRPSEIYINNGKLVVIGSDSQIMKASVYKNFKRQSPYSFVKIFDVRNPEEPKQVRDLNFEGTYQTSRLIDGRLYLIINNYNQYVAGETVTPRLVDGGKILSNSCEDKQACFAPDIYYFDAPYESFNLTSINSINLSNLDEAVSSQAYLLNGAQTIYVSAKNIYITYAQYLNEIDIRAMVLRDLLFGRLSESEQELLLKIETLDNSILSQSEKRQKILAVFQRFLDSKATDERSVLDLEINDAITAKYKEEHDNWERTVIYRFGLSNGIPVYRAQGSVSGIVLNQFALDENTDSYLRIATTRSASLSSLMKNEESYSNVYILNSELKISGSLENLAPGERIYSVRFMGNRAYLVTFKQVDPLFVLDLTNYKAPKLLGELKIPGFSSYLHPYDENTLIGVGRDTKTDVYGNVVNGGIKLSLFDVSNPAVPKELDNYVAGESGSDSLALDNHKAFLFSKDKNLLVIPASLTNTSSSYRPYFSGALVFSIDDKKFNLRGQIDHSDGGRYQKSDFWCGYNCYDNSVQRALYIQDKLYTFSNKYLKLNSLNDLNTIQSVKLIADTEIDLNVEVLSKEVIVDTPPEEPEPDVLIGPSLPIELIQDGGEVVLPDEATINSEVVSPADEGLNNLDDLPI